MKHKHAIEAYKLQALKGAGTGEKKTDGQTAGDEEALKPIGAGKPAATEKPAAAGRIYRGSTINSIVSEGGFLKTGFGHRRAAKLLLLLGRDRAAQVLKHLLPEEIERITAEISFFPGEIRIEESEDSAPCDCHCLYDVNYEFRHLKPGTYRIAVTGPYQREDDPPLEFDIDLRGPRSGFVCVERTHYPWFR